MDNAVNNQLCHFVHEPPDINQTGFMIIDQAHCFVFPFQQGLEPPNHPIGVSKACFRQLVLIKQSDWSVGGSLFYLETCQYGLQHLENLLVYPAALREPVSVSLRQPSFKRPSHHLAHHAKELYRATDSCLAKYS